MTGENQDAVEDLNETEEIETEQETENEEEITEKEEQEPEAWQRTDDELAPVPAKTHIREKQKLKGRLSEKDDEISQLKAKIENFERSVFPQTGQPNLLKRPSELDYDSDEGYQQALAKYEDELVTRKFQELENKRQQEQAYRTHQQSLYQAVEDHYERASKLIEQAGITPEVYKQSDASVRGAVNLIAPGRGDIIVDQMIANIGDGSDKVMYYLGRNQSALSQFKSLLVEDPSGIKASIFLGQQKERLTNPKRMKSRAPAPSPTANGDANMGSNITALQKKYDAAHKKGDHQTAWKYRREARKSGVDTSKW